MGTAIAQSSSPILAHWVLNRETVYPLWSAIHCAPPPPRPLLATSCGHAPVVQLLLSSGASTTVKDADGHTPLNVIAEDTIARLFEAYRNT